MKTMFNKNKIRTGLALSILLCLFACKKKEYEIPTLPGNLQNDVIKRSLGPNVAGLNIEFAYAMALAKTNGKIVSAQVEASIPGATGTFLEHRSFYTNSSGQDIGVTVGSPSVTNKNTTTVNFTVDTNAATLRYYYVVPQEAKGQSVSFTFSAKSSNGETVSYQMGPYPVSKVNMVLDLPVSDGNACYISIADNAVYNSTAAAASPDKIDLVYLYRSIPNIQFGHALVAPATDAAYRPGITLPAGVNRSAKIGKVNQLRDQQLARLQFGVFIDDRDFQELDLTAAPDYALNLKAQAGIWVETADKKYRAYVYVNAINDGTKTAIISIKRYPL